MLLAALPGVHAVPCFAETLHAQFLLRRVDQAVALSIGNIAGIDCREQNMSLIAIRDPRPIHGIFQNCELAGLRYLSPRALDDPIVVAAAHDGRISAGLDPPDVAHDLVQTNAVAWHTPS